MYIYQVGKKWNKKVCGVENFDKSMTLMKEAYADAARDKNLKERSYDSDNDFSSGKLEEAYRTGNLDLLDTINKANSTSAAFDEKFLYQRNDIQAASIDSILKTKVSLFVGVGAAHLPGERGVIEWLRKRGYRLRPIKMTERDSRHKEEIENIRVPVRFSRQVSDDGFFSVDLPGKWYSFSRPSGLVKQQQYADMSNGCYYMVTRIFTNATLWGHSTETVHRKIDSVLYENIPGKILSKQVITRNGYKGFDIVNRTRRGDYQRYNIFVTPFEVIMFKMSGNGEYVSQGTEASRFFSSIRLNEYENKWQTYHPPFGGFAVELPHPPFTSNTDNWRFQAYDPVTKTGFEVLRTDVHNTGFVEEDSFDLNLLEESFASSDFIDKQVSRRHSVQNGYAALEAKYKYKNGSVALVKFIIQGPHYYTLVANAAAENPRMTQFLNSFSIKPLSYKEARQQADTSLFFTVSSPVLLEKEKKLDMYPQNLYRFGGGEDDDSVWEENGTYKDLVVASDSTGEKVYVSFYKPSRYQFEEDTRATADSLYMKTGDQNWQVRAKKKYELANGMVVREYELGDPRSSRVIRVKSFSRHGVQYSLMAQGDTLTKPSPFLAGFFATFTPAATIRGVDPPAKKSSLFFSDLFSKDTLLHKKAIKNVHLLAVDSSDFVPLQKAIESLSWKEKKYLDVKNSFVYKLGSMPTKVAADYLKKIYYAANDTVDIQYTALEALLRQQTAYSYQVFKEIMTEEPPVLDFRPGNGVTYQTTIYRPDSYVDHEEANGSFIDSLKDSLLLTQTIFKDLLPLMNINDYEPPMMDLLETMVDSNLVRPKDYEGYLPRFLLEAKHEMKKQVISEKNKSIEKAQASA